MCDVADSDDKEEDMGPSQVCSDVTKLLYQGAKVSGFTCFTAHEKCSIRQCVNASIAVAQLSGFFRKRLSFWKK